MESGMRNEASPMALSLREQIVSNTNKRPPSPQSRCAAESFTSCPRRFANVPKPLSILSARQRFAAPSPERAATLTQVDSNRKPRQHRRMDLPDLQKAVAFEPAPSWLREHSSCSSHRLRKGRDGCFLSPRDSNRHPE